MEHLVQQKKNGMIGDSNIKLRQLFWAYHYFISLSNIEQTGYLYRTNGIPVPAKGIISIGQFGIGIINVSQFGLGMVSISQFTIAIFALAQIGIAYSLIAQIGLYIDKGYGQIVRNIIELIKIL